MELKKSMSCNKLLLRHPSHCQWGDVLVAGVCNIVCL